MSQNAFDGMKRSVSEVIKEIINNSPNGVSDEAGIASLRLVMADVEVPEVGALLDEWVAAQWKGEVRRGKRSCGYRALGNHEVKEYIKSRGDDGIVRIIACKHITLAALQGELELQRENAGKVNAALAKSEQLVLDFEAACGGVLRALLVEFKDEDDSKDMAA
jgi:hypothetical protein